jgi:hypothetical protein
MSTKSKARSSGAVLRSSSPGGRFYSPSRESSLTATASAFASSTSSSFSSPASSFFNRRSGSPPRVNFYSSPSTAQSGTVRFSIDRSISPSRSISVSPRHNVIKNQGGSIKRRTCMCSPTTHPGSFRCSLHKNSPTPGGQPQSSNYPPNRLNMRRSAMSNSLVRIGGVEGDLVRRALAALIRPSSHQQRRRSSFQPKPSRLSVMSKAEDS